MADSAKGSRKTKSLAAALVLGTALSALPAQAAEARPIEDLGRYCTACWRNARLQPDAWNDCTQDVLLRLLERVPAERWDHVLDGETVERREFVRAIDTVKKRVQRQRRFGHLADPDAVADNRNGSDDPTAAQRQILLGLTQRLSPRQAEIIRLSLKGLSARVISRQMNISASRVSDEKYKAIRKLRRLVAEHSASLPADPS